MAEDRRKLGLLEDPNLEKRDVSDADEEPPVQLLASTYIPEEHRIRDSAPMAGYRVLTFAQIMKYGRFPLAEMLTEVLTLGQEGMGCPVELEFSVNVPTGPQLKPQFAFLQLRPMTARADLLQVNILDDEAARAFCISYRALGNAEKNDMADILFVKPDGFDPAKTPQIAREISELNAGLLNASRKYLLIGPGRWGSADRWLGIPVSWADICGVGAMVETSSSALKADPSQGSHFFHNITTLGITYATVSEDDFIDWNWLTSQTAANETAHVVHLKLDRPFVLKVDGRSSKCVMYLAG